LPAVTGDGVSQSLNDNQAIPAISQPFNIFLVMKQISQTDNAVVLKSNVESDQPIRVSQQPSLSDVIEFDDNDVAIDAGGALPADFAIYRFRDESALSSVTIGATVTTGDMDGGDTFGGSGNGTFLFGDGESSFSNVSIAEAVLFGSLTDAQATAITNALKAKYGL
jgi:hypothetical protein